MSGNVVEIHARSGVYEGAIMSDDGRVAHFVTPLDTDGIVSGSWAAFRGVFVQEYDYANVSGGQTQSMLLVGGFLR